MKTGKLLARLSGQETSSIIQKSLNLPALTCLFLAEGVGILLLYSWVFYDRLIVAVILSPYLFFFVKKQRCNAIVKHREKLASAFTDGMEAVTSALIAGYSIENSFTEALPEIELLHGKKSVIYASFARISNLLKLYVQIEEAFYEFASESRIEEIQTFSQILNYAKKSGGNLVSIIKNTTTNISEKIEVKREISTIISAKKMEQSVMNFMPLGIVVYMRLTSSDMFGVLYGNALGIIVMTVCFALYLVAKYIADKIVDIRV